MRFTKMEIRQPFMHHCTKYSSPTFYRHSSYSEPKPPPNPREFFLPMVLPCLCQNLKYLGIQLGTPPTRPPFLRQPQRGLFNSLINLLTVQNYYTSFLGMSRMPLKLSPVHRNGGTLLIFNVRTGVGLLWVRQQIVGKRWLKMQPRTTHTSCSGKCMS